VKESVEGEATPNVIAIVQARMTSSRLPGKVLRPLHGHAMILQQLERIRQVQRIDRIVVATSVDPSDDILCKVLAQHGIEVVRGPLNDVLARFLCVLGEDRESIVVRLTADCPLISPAVITEAVEAFNSTDVDYLSNTLEPTFPDGLDVEVVSASALHAVALIATDPDELEHVTLGIYRRPENFKLGKLIGNEDHSNLRWTVDNLEDFHFVEAIYGALYDSNPHFEFEDVLRLLAEGTIISRTTRDAKRNSALDGKATGAMRHR
jgi:spore coat polysaccharide biosynthesis protein SpsF